MLITHSFFTETVSLETGQLNTGLEVLEYQKTTAKEPVRSGHLQECPAHRAATWDEQQRVLQKEEGQIPGIQALRGTVAREGVMNYTSTQRAG